MLSIFPRSAKFGPLLAEVGENALATARALLDLMEHFSDLDAGLARLRDCERRGDELTRQMLDLVRDSFIVPFDREDILALAEQLDDFVDHLEDVGKRLKLYRVGQPTAQALELARIAVGQAEVLTKVLPSLGEPRRAHKLVGALEEVRTLESRGDVIMDEVQASMFDSASDIPSLVAALRLSEVYALLDEAVDGAQRIANRIEEVLLKNA